MLWRPKLRAVGLCHVSTYLGSLMSPHRTLNGCLFFPMTRLLSHVVRGQEGKATAEEENWGWGRDAGRKTAVPWGRDGD